MTTGEEKGKKRKEGRKKRTDNAKEGEREREREERGGSKPEEVLQSQWDVLAGRRPLSAVPNEAHIRVVHLAMVPGKGPHVGEERSRG